MSRLTLEEIAELAGVSRSTVSRVINNQASVRPEVRSRVQQVIEETGFQPNQAARALASNRSGVIGLVIPRIVQSLFTDPYFPRLMQGIAHACNAHDLTLALFLLHTEDEEQKLYSRVMSNSVVDGVILASAAADDPLVDRAVESDIPFLTIGRPNNPGASYIDVDNVRGAYTAVTHLLDLGYKRIATISGRNDMNVALDRLQGYRLALKEYGHSVDEQLIVPGDFTEFGAYHAMQRLLPHRLDAVFAASDPMALGAIRALRDAGVGVPDQVAVAGYDDLPTAATSDPPLTTIRQPIRRIGALAVNTIRDILNTGSQPPRRIVLPTELVIRKSSGAT